MATRVRISCINKHEHYNPHERIINIGDVNPDGSRWKMTQLDAIAAIKRGEKIFYVKVR